MKTTFAGVVLAVSVAVAGCGGSSDSRPPFACKVSQQKQSIVSLMQEWYLYNDEPDQQLKYASIDAAQYATPEELLEALRYRPDRFDRGFSFLTTASADQQFFGAGQFVGFGFGSKFADAPLDTDLRLTQVFVDSPAAAAGLARGQRILAIDGRTLAEIAQAEGLSAALGPDDVGLIRTFSVRRVDDSEFQVTVAKRVVTIDPVPAVTIMNVGGAVIGYLDFRTFVSTANSELEQAFAQFEMAGVSALVVDLRYNGGGLVSVAERLADLIGGFVAAGEVRSQTLYNDAKSALDTVTTFQTRTNSLSLLQQVVFITTRSSASASELVINALAPHSVVRLVGATSFGKPVGQAALGYCGGGRILRAVSFETVNSLGAGRYYDGLPVDCAAEDELERAVGDPLEASLASALELIETGSCPVPAVSPKSAAPFRALSDPSRSAATTSAQHYANAF